MKNQKQATSIPIELLRKYDRPGPRYTSYPTAPVWSNDVGSDAYIKALKNASAREDEPFAVYCHIPFCECRCYYCGCNTVITKNSDKVTTYIQTLKKEIKNTAKHLKNRKNVNQLHFGGGTPTYLSIEQFNDILDTLDSAFEFIEGCEKSIEIDPRVTTEEQIKALVDRGFNRISMGVQDFDNDVQIAIGRIQSFELVQQKVDFCKSLNFEGVNIDLIYGLPKQSIESFKETLSKAISLKPDRVALYSFAYLPSVKANQMKIVESELPVTEDKYKLFALAVEMFTEAGYLQIGMDHFALPNDELSIAQNDGRLHRNFMGYTVQASPEMIGIGMSSIGYIDNSFFQSYSVLSKYMEAVEESGFAVFRGMQLNQDDLIRQYVINSLMCNFHLSFDEFQKKFDIQYHDYFSKEHKELSEFFVDNFLDAPSGGLKISEIGKTFIRNIAMVFDAYLNKDSDGKKPTFSRTI